MYVPVHVRMRVMCTCVNACVYSWALINTTHGNYWHVTLAGLDENSVYVRKQFAPYVVGFLFFFLAKFVRMCTYMCKYVCMCVCMCARVYVVCVYTWMYMCMCVCVHVYAHLCVYGDVYVSMYVCAHVGTCECVHEHVCMYMCLCVWYMCEYVCTCMYVCILYMANFFKGKTFAVFPIFQPIAKVFRLESCPRPDALQKYSSE